MEEDQPLRKKPKKQILTQLFKERVLSHLEIQPSTNVQNTPTEKSETKFSIYHSRRSSDSENDFHLEHYSTRQSRSFSDWSNKWKEIAEPKSYSVNKQYKDKYHDSSRRISEDGASSRIKNDEAFDGNSMLILEKQDTNSSLLSKSFCFWSTPSSNFQAERRQRLSERFTTSSSSTNVSKKRKSFETSPINSPSMEHPTSGNKIFDNEFKSTDFIRRLDEKQLKTARNILEIELNSDLPFVDTHCHFDFLFKRLSYNGSIDDYMDKTFFKFPSNFEGCIADWCQPSLYHTARSILRRGCRNLKLWGAFGCHPHFVNEYNDSVEKQIEFHLDTYDNLVAWGEMGLDYSDRFGPTDHKLQQSIFIRQLKNATKRNLPLVIHCRDADPDLIKIMKKYVPHDARIHRHCLTTEAADVEELLEYFPNCYVGFTNLLTNRSAYRPRDAVNKIPLQRIILETDAPYFIPKCISAKSRGAARWSHPGMASSVACEIAYIKDISADNVLEVVRDNVSNLYGV